MKELEIPSWNELFMRHAYLISTKSKDTRTKIGSILVKDKIIISSGFNGLPRGIDDNKPERYERPLKYSFFAHSELNSVLNCARNGLSCLGSTCFVMALPCSSCCKALIQGGIQKVVIHKQHNDFFLKDEKWLQEAAISSIMFKEAGIEVEELDIELGIETLCDGKIIKV